MMRFRVQIAVWSTLHDPVRISESFCVLVFESPGVSALCEHWVWIAQLGSNRCNTQPNTWTHMNRNIHTHWYTLVHIYALYTYIYTTKTHIHIHTLIYINTYIYTLEFIYTHLHSFVHTHYYTKHTIYMHTQSQHTHILNTCKCKYT